MSTEKKAPPDISNVSTLQKSYGTNWYIWNVKTLNGWILISAQNIKILELAIGFNRRILRYNSALGIIMSSLTGTLSVSQYGNLSTSNLYFILFTILSFAVAIGSGFMKIYQIQEKLEEYIKMKQQWISFSTLIVSEIQLPVNLRQDAVFLIWKHKAQFLDLLKADVEIPRWIRRKAEIQINKEHTEADYSISGKRTNLSNLINDINSKEMVQATHRHTKAQRNGGLTLISCEKEHFDYNHAEASDFIINDETNEIDNSKELPVLDKITVVPTESIKEGKSLCE